MCRSAIGYESLIMDTQMDIARDVAPEDIAVGDYVTVAHVTYEFVRLCDRSFDDAVKTQRVTLMCPSAGQPWKVVSICLPYLFVRAPEGHHDTLDVRRHRLARLSEAYGNEAFKRLKTMRKAKV